MRRTATVRGLLKQAKHYSSIALDLALYSLASGSRVAALEALRIEEQVDQIVRELVARTSLAVRSPDQAGLAVAVLETARAFDRLTDAAGDLAGLVIRGYPVHEYIKAVVNCCGEAVGLITAERGLDRIPEIVDLLLVRRGSSYLLAPEDNMIMAGDVLVVRGTPEEIADLAQRVGAPDPLAGANEAVAAASAGDELAEKLLLLRGLSRVMIDLAFHALIYEDKGLADLILQLEESSDTLFHEILRLSYAASSPQLADEMVSIAVFAQAMEAISDASTLLARLVAEGGYGEYLEFLGETIEEAEESFARLVAGPRLDGIPLASLHLSERGVTVLALGRNGSWTVTVPPNAVLRRGDILLVKYYRPEGEKSDEEILAWLRSLGFGLEEE